MTRSSRTAWRGTAALAAALALAAGCERAGAAPVPDQPTFAADVAPILHSRCAQCHRPEGVAPFSLLGYEDARSRAALIALMTTQRRMPPWLPGPSDHPFADERRLTDREIAIIARWAEQGAPLGDPAQSPAPPVWPQGWSLGEPDLIVEMPEGYSVPAEGDDVFRHFVVPLPLEQRRYVRALELQPGEAEVVHHVVMAIDPTPASREQDASDPEPGFDGMLGHTSARPPPGFFAGWTPGLVPRSNPDDLAWPIDPGTDLVLQMHLRPHGHAANVRARVGLYFSDTPPTRTPVLLRLGSQTIDIPAGDVAYVTTDSLRLPVDVSLLALYPHAHYLARTMDVRARLPNGRETRLLRIEEWDFDWQDAYTFRTPVDLPAGTTIHLRYLYDNSAANPRNPHSPPRRVVYGPASTDEMAEVWIQALPAEQSGLAILQREVDRKATRDRLAGLEHMIRVDPGDAIAHAGLAEYLQAVRQETSAIDHYRLALEAQPDFAQAHYNLAALLRDRGDLEGAVRHFRGAADAWPDHPATQHALGRALAAQGATADALGHLRRAVELDTANADAHNDLAALLRGERRYGEAIQHYRRVVDLLPQSAPARFNLALALAAGGQPDEALEQYRRTLGPGLVVEAQIAIAWSLATHPDPRARRPAEALAIAEEVARRIGPPHPLVLDVIAAAEAAAGRFDRASAIADEAFRLALASGQDELAADLRERLLLYRAGRPYATPN